MVSASLSRSTIPEWNIKISPANVLKIVDPMTKLNLPLIVNISSIDQKFPQSGLTNSETDMPRSAAARLIALSVSAGISINSPKSLSVIWFPPFRQSERACLPRVTVERAANHAWRWRMFKRIVRVFRGRRGNVPEHTQRHRARQTIQAE